MNPSPPRRSRTLRYLLLVLVAVAFAASQDRYLIRRAVMHRGGHETIHWMTGLPDATARARREKRPLYIDFYATWCGPCKEMLAETYTDPDVARRLNTQFVPVLIDIDVQEDLASKFNVGAIPDGAFLAPDGREIGRSIGFHDADAFLDISDQALKAFAKLPPPTPTPPPVQAGDMSSSARPTPPAPMPSLPLGFP